MAHIVGLRLYSFYIFLVTVYFAKGEKEYVYPYDFRMRCN